MEAQAPQGSTYRLQTWLPDEIAERLREEAFRSRRTRTDIVIEALETYFFASKPEAEQTPA